MSGEFWWFEHKPNEPVFLDSKIELGEKFFEEVIRRPVPLDMNTQGALKRSSLGLDLYLWLTYRMFTRLRATSFCPGGSSTGNSEWTRTSRTIGALLMIFARTVYRVKEDQGGLAGIELLDGEGRPGLASLGPGHYSAIRSAAP